jgi:hypothetical protein
MVVFKLESVYETIGGNTEVDSAFSPKWCPFFIKSGKKKHRKTEKN